MRGRTAEPLSATLTVHTPPEARHPVAIEQSHAVAQWVVGQGAAKAWTGPGRPWPVTPSAAT